MALRDVDVRSGGGCARRVRCTQTGVRRHSDDGGVHSARGVEPPARTYVVTAKTEIASQGTASDPPVDVHCELIPSNEDGTPGLSGSTQNDFASRRLAPLGGTGASDGFVLFVTQRLTQPGSVVLGCSASGNASGAAANYSSIRAVEVGSVTTSEFPGPLP